MSLLGGSIQASFLRPLRDSGMLIARPIFLMMFMVDHISNPVNLNLPKISQFSSAANAATPRLSSYRWSGPGTFVGKHMWFADNLDI